VTVALVLWAYALVLTTLGALALRRSSWVDRAPRLAIATWQALSVSVMLATALGGLALMVPTEAVSTNLAGLLGACAMALRTQFATPAGAATAIAGLAVAVSVMGRWAYCWLAESAKCRRIRRHHRQALTLVGRIGPRAGITLLDHDRPVVYCLAGRPHRIVLSTAANDALHEPQLDAVLAHERAHLRGRHDLAVGAAVALAHAFPWLRLFRDARDEITRLVELLADDHATRGGDRLTLAEAMLTLAADDVPAGTLAAGGSTAAQRIRRLIEGHRPVPAWGRGLGLAAAIGLVALPMAALVAPAAAAGTDCCVDRHPPARAVEECLVAARDAACGEI
jgi:Zn-dependent protease with chaperone function